MFHPTFQNLSQILQFLIDPITHFFKKLATMNKILLSFFIFFCFCTSNLNGQQGYSQNSIHRCNNSDKEGPSPTFLYTCNSKPSCPAFLIFLSQPPYNSIPAISNLTSSDPLEVARLNNVSRFSDFPTGKEVIVPVNCSCSGQYYQANASYLIPSYLDTYSSIAVYTYQGLSTCDSLKYQNTYDEFSLDSGMELRVPLRCACPTSNQIANGTKYLLTYSISEGDDVDSISERFNGSRKSTLDANGFSEEEPTIYPSTTILIPLVAEPSSSETIIHYPPPIISPSLSANPRKMRSTRGLYVGIGIATGSSVLLCAVLFIAFQCYKKKLRKAEGLEKGKKKWVLPEDFLAGIASADKILKVYKFEELKAATHNFSPEFRVKGSIYRGVFSEEVLAIKRTSIDVSKEVNILNKVNHFNLIRLYGVCEDQGYFYLVYDYMENGSLRDWLHNKSRPEVQSWTHRVQIALDVANGLHYLHNFTDPACVHKDIKSSNILLNGFLRAKIANFGLAISTENKPGEVSLTRHITGTRGYMAPEYLLAGVVTPKADIYALGVVLLELITGKDAIIKHGGGEQLLSAAIISVMEGGNAEAELVEFMDPSLQKNYPKDLALGVAKLSVTCLTQDPLSRPSMGEVVSALSKIRIESQKWESYGVSV